MRLAYIISAYKYPQHLVRLVNALQADFSNFYIHVDKKTAQRDFHEMQSGLSGSNNVTFLPRHRCIYASFGHVRASLKGIHAALAQVPKIDYAVLLTGQDYPIKSNAYIHDFFETNVERCFIESRPLPEEDWGVAEFRLEHWHFFTTRRLISLPSRGLLRRKLPGGVKAYGGASYWNLSRAALEYIAETAGSRLSRFFRYAQVPDEYYFQTILMNSPLKKTVVNDSLRYLDWSKPVGWGPAILDRSYILQLQKASGLFARKFDETKFPGVLDAIDGMIKNQS